VANLKAASRTVDSRALPFAGRWHNPPRSLDLELLVRQFRNRYPEDTLRFLELAREQRVERGTDRESELAEEDAQTHWELGKAYRLQEKWELAAAQFKESLRLKPNFAEAHNALGTVLRTQGKVDESLEHFRQAARLRAGSFEVQLNFGKMLRAERRLDEAIATLQQAVEIEPDSATGRWHLAVTLRMADRLDEAINELRKAVEIDPDHLEARADLGAFLQASGDHMGAIPHLKKAIEMNPNVAPLHFYLAFSLQALGKDADAINEMRIAKKLAPKNANVCLQLGVMLVKSGNMQDAIESLRDAVRLQPDWLPPMVVITEILATHPDARIRDADEAVRIGKRAAELSGHKNAEILDRLAAAYAAAGHFEDAVRTGEQALELAHAAGNEQFMKQVRDRLELYRQRKTLYDPERRSVEPASSSEDR